MNKVILSGNLCKEIEVKQTASGKSVVSNSVAVRRDYKNAQGEYDSDFINIVVWGASAEYLSNYASKGDRVELVGRWQNRDYDDTQGNKRIVSEVVVESITAFAKQDKQDKKPAKIEGATPVYDQDLPF